jgi:hypothetical protein
MARAAGRARRSGPADGYHITNINTLYEDSHVTGLNRTIRTDRTMTDRTMTDRPMTDRPMTDRTMTDRTIRLGAGVTRAA